MRWPGRLPAGAVYREPVVSRDLAPPTLLAAGLSHPAPPPRTLFWRAGQARAVRRGPWKLVEFGDEFTGLYNLADDLGETRDRSREQPALLAELRAARAAWSKQMNNPAPGRPATANSPSTAANATGSSISPPPRPPRYRPHRLQHPVPQHAHLIVQTHRAVRIPRHERHQIPHPVHRIRLFQLNIAVLGR